MEASDLLNLIGGGETSKVQFKQDINNPDAAANEIIAFANTRGGVLIIGVDDKTGSITGLDYANIQRISTLLTTAASENVKPAIIITTETVQVNATWVMVVHIPKGIQKPYKNKDGIIYIKNGADKRKVTSNDEIKRLLQESGGLYAEEVILQNAKIETSLDYKAFYEFYEKKYGETLEQGDVALKLENLRLAKDGYLNLAGGLLFAKRAEQILPQFYITAIWFNGIALTDEKYVSKEYIFGTLDVQFSKGLGFLKSALLKLQNGREFNTVGELEIPEIVLKELLVNALIHRDYFISDSIKLFVFSDRIEIKSPGKLPNNLTEEQIKRGIRRSRNNLLNSFALDLLPFTGTGSGILRALKTYSHIHFFNDIEGEQFTVTIFRQRHD